MRIEEGWLAKRRPARRRPSAPNGRGRRKRAEKSVGLEPSACAVVRTDEFQPTVERVQEEGGCVIAPYRDPLGGQGARPGMRRLCARSITALIIQDREVARQILALNTEKAHNLKERSLEVFRIYRGLVQEQPREPELRFAFYLEDPSLVTLGILYDQRRQFAGGAYHPVLRRVEAFSDDPLQDAFEVHQQRSALVAELEDRVADIIAALKKRGLQSPYLRPFVVARINPLRWITGDEAPLAEKVLRTMLDRATKFKIEKVTQQDLVGAYGAPPEE